MNNSTNDGGNGDNADNDDDGDNDGDDDFQILCNGVCGSSQPSDIEVD